MSNTSPVAMENANRLEAEREIITAQFGDIPVAWSHIVEGKLYNESSKPSQTFETQPFAKINSLGSGRRSTLSSTRSARVLKCYTGNSQGALGS